MHVSCECTGRCCLFGVYSQETRAPAGHGFREWTKIISKHTSLMRTFLRKIGCVVGENIVLPERLVAAKAGVEGIGSFVYLTSFIVDRERNAAIAIGNLGDPAFVPDLAVAMDDLEELVRGYAAWALGKIGGESAKHILEVNLERETS